MATIKGKWQWNATIDDNMTDPYHESITFESNNEKFVSISKMWTTGINMIIYYDSSDRYVQFRDCSEPEVETINEKYRVMDFGEIEQGISEGLYEFIVANAEPYFPTIAEKLAVIAENEQRVYDKGYQVGNDAGYDEGLEVGYEDGFAKAESDFWDMIQDHGNRTDYGQAFRNWRSRTEYLRPKYKVVPTASTSAMNTFYNCEGLKKVEAEYFDFSKKARGGYQGSGWYHTFTTCGELEEIEDIGMMPDTDYTNTFQYCTNLKKVAKITVDVNTVISPTIFGSCPALESVTFDGEIGYGMNLKWSTKLTEKSIRNIIEHLSDNVSGKTLTLSKAAVDEAFKFVSEYEDGTRFEVLGSAEDNPYWPQLRDSKPNWQITLV